jgi:hypothetical protein
MILLDVAEVLFSNLGVVFDILGSSFAEDSTLANHIATIDCVENFHRSMVCDQDRDAVIS